MKPSKFSVLVVLAFLALFQFACTNSTKINDDLVTMDTEFDSSFDDVAVVDEEPSFEGGLVDENFTIEEIDDIQYDPNAEALPSNSYKPYTQSAFVASSTIGYPQTKTTVNTTSSSYSKSSGSYTVQKGDSLWLISRKFGTSISALARANNISNKNFIKAGQTIIIPDGAVVSPSKTSVSATTSSANGNTYKVQSGDSYYTIAKKFGVTMAALMAHNNTSSPDLQIGQVIQIP